ncbi:hypothetical protein [Kitasatospora sp. MBT63]|uniref:hypothetical protein n=1 Tax=Kitasatospora sp. MBT63 TaxID=1444768 RepID=UPI00053AA00C|nr:hypothetical protein [Kitasatospora sp. MBT63]
MDQHPYTPPTAAVLYIADGQPLYAAPPQTAPLTLYRPVPQPNHQAVPLHAIDPTSVYLPAQAAEPGRDVWPARLLAGGIGTGAAGIGLGFLFQAIAAAATGIGLLAAVLALIWLLKNTSGSGGGGRGGAVNLSVNVTNRNR